MESLPDLPPRVPDKIAELDRSIELLYAVGAMGKVKDKHRIQLETLLGCRVTKQLALHWTPRLKEIRRDVAGEPRRAPVAKVQREVAPTGTAVEPLPDLPPRVPEDLAELDRADQLLGAWCRSGNRMDVKYKIELEDLLGARLTQQLASHWRSHLREIRRDLAAEMMTPDPDA